VKTFDFINDYFPAHCLSLNNYITKIFLECGYVDAYPPEFTDRVVRDFKCEKIAKKLG